ncbi:MAG: hypothetical protein Ta2E_10520 [Mycoplasmoidaceae bacterium]|nr:MAG: hypothetical protein Ta2E_10520 [Mycoplasmoidaceae bacterium]
MDFLNKHIRVKKKYYAIFKYLMNHFKEPNETMKRILDKRISNFFGSRRLNGRLTNDVNRRIKIIDYQKRIK